MIALRRKFYSEAERLRAKREYNRVWQQQRRLGNSAGSFASNRVDVPPEVLTDSVERLTAPRSLTAILCGDPAKGQSALDKKRSGVAP